MLADLNIALVAPEPLQALAHRRMTGWQTGLPERIHDQPGRIAIRFREERSVRRSGRAKRLSRLAPSPCAERSQGPSPVGALPSLKLCDERLALFFGQQVFQTRRSQQQPNPTEE